MQIDPSTQPLLDESCPLVGSAHCADVSGVRTIIRTTHRRTAAHSATDTSFDEIMFSILCVKFSWIDHGAWPRHPSEARHTIFGHSFDVAFFRLALVV